MVFPSIKTILLVDDQDDILDLLEFDFTTDGHEVFRASNGQEAFELLKTKSVDLIISDIQMPKWNGLKMLQNINQTFTAKPKIFFITGYAAGEIITELYKEGACEVIHKPFSYHQLIKKISDYLAAHP